MFAYCCYADIYIRIGIRLRHALRLRYCHYDSRATGRDYADGIAITAVTRVTRGTPPGASCYAVDDVTLSLLTYAYVYTSLDMPPLYGYF